MVKPNRNSSESIVREIKRNTGRHFSSEDKIRMVLDSLSPDFLLRYENP